MLFPRCVRRQHPQIAGHAEMNHERAFGGTKEHVFGPASAGVEAAAFKLVNRVRHRPAQAFVTNDHLTHTFANHMR